MGNGWGCEAGWTDTGADWQYGPNGDKQCEKCGGSQMVTVYVHTEYRGEEKSYPVGDYPEIGLDWNDKISSLKIPDGLKVILYEHTNFQGRSLTLNATWHNNLNDWKLSDGGYAAKNVCGPKNNECWNDIVSSMKVMYA